MKKRAAPRIETARYVIIGERKIINAAVMKRACIRKAFSSLVYMKAYVYAVCKSIMPSSRLKMKYQYIKLNSASRRHTAGIYMKSKLQRQYQRARVDRNCSTVLAFDAVAVARPFVQWWEIYGDTNGSKAQRVGKLGVGREGSNTGVNIKCNISMRMAACCNNVSSSIDMPCVNK